jgi:hypothetical protein
MPELDAIGELGPSVKWFFMGQIGERRVGKECRL